MLKFTLLHPKMTLEHLGFIPEMLSEEDPRPVREQLDENYAHGGGWDPFKGFKMREDNSIKYPGDPAHPPLARARLREETIYFYESAWVAIVQPDGSFEISRMD